MKLGELVLRLRSTTTTFVGRVGGVAELAQVEDKTFAGEMAFIVPLQATVTPNDHDNYVLQPITEMFGIVVAIKNDTDFKDKTGFIAYNRLHDLRQEMFEAFLGLDASLILGDDASFAQSSVISYQGEILLDFNRAYIWYQFTFAYDVVLESQAPEDATDYLDIINAQYEVTPSNNIPYDGDLPVELFAPDMTQIIDYPQLRADKERFEDYGFDEGYAEGFDYEGAFQLLSQSDKLVSLWPFNEATGTIASDRVGYNHGTLTNMEGNEWVNGISGSAIMFDADDEEVNCGVDKSLDLGVDDFSISMWVKAPSILSGTHYLLRKFDADTGYYLSVDSLDAILAGLKDPDGSVESAGTTVIFDGELHHIVAVFDRSGSASVYIDKVLDHTVDISSVTGTVSSSADFIIGDNCNGVTIDETRLYRRILNSAEIEWLYNNPAGY